METVLVNIDINGFVEICKGKTHDEVAAFLLSFYKTVEKALPVDFQIVKAIGDGVLVRSPGLFNGTMETKIRELKTKLDESNPVEVSYRLCSVALTKVKLMDYNCLDVFGNDVNALYLKDEKTVVVT